VKNYFIIIILLFFTTNLVSAEQKIVYIDLDKILSNSIAGNQLIKQIKSLTKKKLDNVKVLGKGLQSDEKKLLAQKNILSPEEMKKKVLLLRKKIDDFKNNRAKTINDLKKIKIDNTNKLLNLINPYIAEYADKNSISMILNQKNIIIGRNELDITQEIIIVIDKNIKEFKI
jgi:outer membrane protein